MFAKITREQLVRTGQGHSSAWIRIRYHEIEKLKAENSRLKQILYSYKENRQFFSYGVLYITLKRLDYEFFDISSAIYNMNNVIEQYQMSDLVELGKKVAKSQK